MGCTTWRTLLLSCFLCATDIICLHLFTVLNIVVKTRNSHFKPVTCNLNTKRNAECPSCFFLTTKVYIDSYS